MEKNTYLGEVLEKQQQIDLELRPKLRAAPASMARAAAATPAAPLRADYRITGVWPWKSVVVAPNVYVVHTRRGRPKPVHIGLGVSFRFNPYSDAFLTIPAAMQTIVINARCIGVERQGILVQAYVQWIIDDIETAYQRLDFSDAEDPMRVVNVQLREQAEAAIKDKVATMHVDEVLSDKQPIIEELTHRLRAVAEGTGNNGVKTGLGLKIVTVQIKEAVVSSTRLWESLQKPFRAERERLARLAELEAARQVAARELEIRQARETAEIEARRATEKAKRDAELALELRALEIVREKVNAELDTIARQRALDEATAARSLARKQAELALTELGSEADAIVQTRAIELARARRAVDNDLSEAHVRTKMIAALPEIAGRLPAPAELRSVNISGDGTGGGAAALTGMVAGLLSLVEPRKAG